MFYTGFLRASVISIALSLQPVITAAQDISSIIGNSLDTLGNGFAAGDVGSFNSYLAAAPSGVAGDTLGHIMFARRHFDKAAWFFGTDALADLNDPVSLNNFSTMLLQTYEDAPDSHPLSWLAASYQASLAAVRLSPDVAAFQNNLGLAAARIALLDQAITAHRRAVELTPDEPLFWTNLARALEAAGDIAGAADALAQAHALEPNGMALMSARAAMPSVGGAYSQAIQRNCNVNFRCQEICPKSIIGGLMSVTCEMESSSAQMACSAGEPYATSYDCNEDLPEYGILIPGLNSGFSIAVPGFSMHVLVQGDGSVDVRTEAGVNYGPVSGYVRADGHYSPSGDVSVDNFGGGVRLSLLPNTPASQLASDLGHPPIHIEAESLDGGPVNLNLETYNAGIISGS